MKYFLHSKKGQVSSIGPSVIALVVAAVFLILGLVVVQNMRDVDMVGQAYSASVVNETLTTVTGAGETLAGNTAPNAQCTVEVVLNESEGGGNTLVIDSNNYTVTDCVVAYVSYWNNTDGLNNTNWNVTYSYTFGGTAFADSNTTVAGMGTFADFWEIIILAIVISVVIGLLLTVFGPRGRR